MSYNSYREIEQQELPGIQVHKTSMDKDRALGVSKAPEKKQQHPAKGVAIYYQVKKPKVGRPKQADKIVYSMEKYFKQIEGDLDENDNLLDDLMICLPSSTPGLQKVGTAGAGQTIFGWTK